MEEIHIYHTNDIHSRLAHWPRIEQAYLKGRAHYEQQTKTTFYAFDLGDAVDQYHPLIQATQGRFMIERLNAAQIDAVTIGNNEGVSLDKTILNQLYDIADFDVVIANLKDEGKQPAWGETFKTYETSEGTRVGIFGLTFPFHKSYGPMGWQIEEPLEIIAEIVKEHRKEVDVLIFLSHLGVHYDREVADKIEGIDLILGAHTHHVLDHGEWLNDTLLAACGCYGTYLGHIELVLDDHHRIVSCWAKAIPTKELPAVAGEEEVVEAWLREGEALLDQQEVARLPRTYKTSLMERSDAGELMLEMIAEATDTEAVILLAGLVVRDLEEGIVTNNDLHHYFPHSMRLAKITLTGKHLRKLFKTFDHLETSFIEQRFVGVGFRGERLGAFIFKDITYDNDQIVFQGTPIQDQEKYTFATVDFFAFSSFFPTIQEYGEVELLFPKFMREAIGEVLQEKFPMKGGNANDKNR